MYVDCHLFPDNENIIKSDCSVNLHSWQIQVESTSWRLRQNANMISSCECKALPGGCPESVTAGSRRFKWTHRRAWQSPSSEESVVPLWKHLKVRVVALRKRRNEARAGGEGGKKTRLEQKGGKRRPCLGRGWSQVAAWAGAERCNPKGAAAGEGTTMHVLAPVSCTACRLTKGT